MKKRFKGKKEYSIEERVAYHERIHNEAKVGTPKRAYSDGWLYVYRQGPKCLAYVKEANAMAKGQTIAYYSCYGKQKKRKNNI